MTRALRKYWRWTTLLGLLLACAGFLYVFLGYEPNYTASAWLRISSQPEYIAFPERPDSREFIEEQVSLIRSPLVLRPVLADPKIARIPDIQEAEDPKEWLAEHIEVQSVDRSDLFTISFTCSNGHDAAKVVNAVYDEYAKLRGDQEAKRNARVLDLLRDEQTRRQSELATLRSKVRELSKQVIVDDPTHSLSNEHDLIRNPLAQLQNERIEKEVEVEAIKAALAALEEDLREAAPEEDLDSQPSTPADDAGQADYSLETEVAILRSKMTDLASKLADAEAPPELEELKADIADVKDRLGRIDLHLHSAGPEQADHKSVVQQRRERITELESRLDDAELAKEMLDQRYKQELERLQNSSRETLDLEFLRADLARAEEVNALISERIVKIETEQRAPERVELELRAEPALTPSTQFPVYRAIAASASGFALPFLAVAFCGAAGSLLSPRRLDDPVFGSIRATRDGWHGETVLEPQGEQTELLIDDGRREGPSDVARQAFLDLRQRYPELRQEIMDQLFISHGTVPTEAASDAPESATPVSDAELRYLAITMPPTSRKAQIELCYATGGQERARAIFWDGQVVRVEGAVEYEPIVR